MTQKSSLIFPLLFLFLLVCSCEKIEDLTTFELNNETELKIPAQGIVNLPLIIRSPEIKTTAEQTFKNNNTRADLVDNAYLTRLEISILSPASQNFDFLNEIKVYIKNNAEKEALLAFKENIQEDGRKILELETTEADLKPFIKEDSYSIRVEATTDQIINQEVEIKAGMTFSVKAKVF